MNLPELPGEVWERVIDLLVIGYTPEIGQTYETNLNLRRDLSSCALVCRAWKVRAQMYLLAFLRISGHGLSQYEALLLKCPALCNSAQELKFYNKYVPDSESKVKDRTIQTASTLAGSFISFPTCTILCWPASISRLNTLACPDTWQLSEI